MVREIMVTLLVVLDRRRTIEFGDDPSVVLDPGGCGRDDEGVGCSEGKGEV